MIVAVLRVLSDFLIWVIVCELFRSKFLTIWLRRCLWFSSSPTVYGNGSDFVSADTLRFLYFRAYNLSSARPCVVIFFTSRTFLYPCFSVLLWGFTNFCWPAYTRTSLSTCLLQPLQLLQFTPFTNFGGGRVNKLLRSAIAESFSQFTKNVLLRRSDRMYCTRRCTIYVPTVPCTVKSTIIVLSSNRSQQNIITSNQRPATNTDPVCPLVV